MIEFQTIYYPDFHPLEGCTDYKLIIFRSDREFKDFQQLVFRAANVWDRAPPHIKEFMDKILHGEVLQDYYAQEGVTRND